ncbi:hypothetical protein YPPY91_3537, partial [Yersinia pestis PY-91]|jgi:hypothetical protein
MLRPG